MKINFLTRWMVAVKQQNDFLLRLFLFTSSNVPVPLYLFNANCLSQLPIQLTLLSEMRFTTTHDVYIVKSVSQTYVWLSWKQIMQVLMPWAWVINKRTNFTLNNETFLLRVKNEKFVFKLCLKSQEEERNENIFFFRFKRLFLSVNWQNNLFFF